MDGLRFSSLPHTVALIGILIGLGHSVLAMSGEETLAQVYREVEHPKLPNLEKAGLVIFVYSLIFTAGVSFFASMIIPDAVRPQYFENLINGLDIEFCRSLQFEAGLRGICRSRRRAYSAGPSIPLSLTRMASSTESPKMAFSRTGFATRIRGLGPPTGCSISLLACNFSRSF